MVINNNLTNNINKISGNRISTPTVRTGQLQDSSQFEKILQEKLDTNTGLKFSKHAEMRLQTRNIHLSNLQMEKINAAVKRAEEKGVKDSLVLVDNFALVVNIKNKTVITAANSNELKENVFTNIDGAVFG